jgi:hypothetical protein
MRTEYEPLQESLRANVGNTENDVEENADGEMRNRGTEDVVDDFVGGESWLDRTGSRHIRISTSPCALLGAILCKDLLSTSSVSRITMLEDEDFELEPIYWTSSDGEPLGVAV